MAVDLSKLVKDNNENEQEPYFRLLVCHTCKTIDELPPTEGDPGDILFSLTVERHGDSHTGRLWNVPAVLWMSKSGKDDIIKQLTEGSTGLDAFGTNFYNTRMQFAEDAMTCYSEHNRPKGQCPDYKSEKKRLKPKTDSDRKQAGLGNYDSAGGPKVYLCDFCPVKSFNMTKHNEQKGLYK